MIQCFAIILIVLSTAAAEAQFSCRDLFVRKASLTPSSWSAAGLELVDSVIAEGASTPDIFLQRTEIQNHELPLHRDIYETELAKLYFLSEPQKLLLSTFLQNALKQSTKTQGDMKNIKVMASDISGLYELARTSGFKVLLTDQFIGTRGINRLLSHNILLLTFPKPERIHINGQTLSRSDYFLQSLAQAYHLGKWRASIEVSHRQFLTEEGAFSYDRVARQLSPDAQIYFDFAYYLAAHENLLGLYNFGAPPFLFGQKQAHFSPTSHIGMVANYLTISHGRFVVEVFPEKVHVRLLDDFMFPTTTSTNLLLLRTMNSNDLFPYLPKEVKLAVYNASGAKAKMAVVQTFLEKSLSIFFTEHYRAYRAEFF